MRSPCDLDRHASRTARRRITRVLAEEMKKIRTLLRDLRAEVANGN